MGLAEHAATPTGHQLYLEIFNDGNVLAAFLIFLVATTPTLDMP
jgi:hypothetical protein